MMLDCLGVATILNLDPHLAVARRLAAGWQLVVPSQKPNSFLSISQVPKPEIHCLLLTGWMAPALGLPVCMQTPTPLLSPPVRLHLQPRETVPSSKAQISERRHVLTSARLNSSLSLMHLRKVGSTACAHRYKECNVLFLWFFIAF